MALGVAELVTGLLDDTRSLVVSVGDQVIANAPGEVERWAIDVFGTADKTALVIGTVVLSLVVGALLGAAATRRFAVAVAGFVAFALLGVWAASEDVRSGTGGALTAGVIGAACGLAAMAALFRSARPAVGAAEHGVTDAPLDAPPPSSAIGAVSARRRPGAGSGTDEAPAPVVAAVPGGVDRRRFVLTGAALAAAAAVSAGIGRSLIDSGRIARIREAIGLPVPTRPAGPVPEGASLSIEGVTPLFVPNDEFYRIDTALTVPAVEPGGWSLEVTGMVDEPFSLTYDELLDMSTYEADVTLSCVSNEVGGGLVGNARWQGVPLRSLLERAGVRDGATQVVGRSVDGFTAGFPTAVGLATEDAMVAVGMNGEPLPARHGFPARLVVPGLYGYVSATKWLSSIELTRWEDVDGYWIPRGWAKEGPIKTQSRIDVPRRGARIPAGEAVVAGVAWAPTRGIDRVEVRVDDGPWQAATLAERLDVDCWRQWFMTWDAGAGEHRLTVRATDGDGETQTERRTDVAPDGATGHHQITVQVTDV